MVHSEILKSIKDYQIKKEKQRLPMHEIDEKIRKVKINKGYSQAICLNKECGYTCCYYCKSPWTKDQLKHEEYPDCLVYQKLIEGMNPDQAWLDSQHIVSCKACKDRGNASSPFTLHMACYVVPCQTCRREYNRTLKDYPHPNENPFGNLTFV